MADCAAGVPIQRGHAPTGAFSAWDRKAHALQPVVLGSSNPVKVSERPGGVARNVCENLARLGTRTGLFAPLGQDDDGDLIAQTL